MSREMTARERDLFNTLFDIGDDVLGRNVYAKDPFKVYRGIIELTINYPSCKTYNLLLDAGKKSFLESMTFYLKTKYPEIKHTENNFEYGPNGGKLHMHSILYVEFEKVGNVSGFIEDITRRLLMTFFPKRYNKFQERCMYYDYARYYSPQIVCQFTDLTDKKRTQEWCDYIRKNNL